MFKLFERTIEFTQTQEAEDKGKANVRNYSIAYQVEKCFYDYHLGKRWVLQAIHTMALLSLPQSLAQRIVSLTTPHS